MPNLSYRDPFHAARRAEAILIRRRLIRLQDETRSLRRLLARKYNPNQPRVPAGNSDGGQWTDGGGGGGAGAGSFGDFGIGIGLGEFGSLGESSAGMVPSVDPTGDGEIWSSYAETSHADGTLASTGVTHRDGGRIHSEYAKPGEPSDWDERHTVTLPDGSKTTFETAGRTQTIREGGPDGPILSRATWTADGPQAEPFVQQAFAGEPAWRAATAAGSLLFGWLSQQNGSDRQAVESFTARDFEPGAGAGPRLGFVGQISRSEAERCCKFLPELQWRLNNAARAVGEANNYPSAAVYGTYVHDNVRQQVDDMRNPNIRAERSFLKELAEPTSAQEVRYGYPSSVRVDIYELREDGTLCVYDIKTGRSGLSLRRSEILARATAMGLRHNGRVIVIEVRPT